MRSRLRVASCAIALAAACTSRTHADTPGADASAAVVAPGRVVLERAGEGPVSALVREAVVRAVAAKRRLVVYVGAAWCEPCQHFHHAAEEGELDATFPNLTLLVFDADRDRGRLTEAGYRSKYIPLFVLPNEDGTSSAQQIEGGLKGDAAVADIVPRLAELLAR